MEDSTQVFEGKNNIVFVDLKDGNMLEIFKDTGCVIEHHPDGTQQQLTKYEYDTKT